MHVLFIHQNFPAQFGHIAAHLVEQHDCECTFLSQRKSVSDAKIRRLQYQPQGGATERTPYLTRTFENAVAHAAGVYMALKRVPEVKPDLIVAHAGFGSSLYLRELYDVPIINHFEYYYHTHNSDLDFRPELPPSEDKLLRGRTRNAMILLDLDNCDVGYTPTRFQYGLFPAEYHGKVHIIFDGVETRIFRRMESLPRRIGGRDIGPDTRVVTYCARGLESMRGFDIFMQAAKRIYEQYPDVVFIVVGSDRIVYGDEKAEKHGHASFREYVLAQNDYDLSKFVFTGLVAPQTLAAILSMGDVHMYLTAPFVLSWSMMNALACGAVVVGSATPPVLEMITDGETGLLADFFDVDGLADQALAVLRDPSAYEPMREAAMRLIESEYSLDTVLPRMLRFYEDTIRSHSSSR